MFLLDTNVVSELRRTKPHGAVLAWLKTVPDADLHISAVSIGEIQAGIELTRDSDPAKAQQIEEWLEKVSQTFNVIDMDDRAFRCWARLMHRTTNDLMQDAMIAATAITHNLKIVTRNVRDFASLRVETFDPFKFAG